MLLKAWCDKCGEYLGEINTHDVGVYNSRIPPEAVLVLHGWPEQLANAPKGHFIAVCPRCKNVLEIPDTVRLFGYMLMG